MSDPVKVYPVTLAVDYPDRELNRLTTFFRGIPDPGRAVLVLHRVVP